MGKILQRKWISSALLCFCVLYHLLEIHETVASVRTASDEWTALDQALLLVEILKSEYNKVLRENNKLQAKNILLEADVQTCGTTTEKPTHVTTRNPLITELTTLLPALPFGHGNTRHRYNLFQYRHRHSPPAYFYYDIPRRFYDVEDNSGYQDHIGMRKWRRFAYDDFLEPQPGINRTVASKFTVAPSQKVFSARTPASTTNVATNSQTISQSSRRIKTSKSDHVYSHISKSIAATLQGTSKIKVNKLMKTTPISSHSSTAVSDQNSSTKRPRTSTFMKKLMLTERVSKVKTISSTHGDPELSQAVAELAKEFGAGFRHRFPVPWRGSTRVFLADSTRYSIPLPENHPFCFTNPRSALCRALV